MEAYAPKRVVAYVPFATFLSAIETLEHTRELPDRFDTSVWPIYSGAIRSQLLAAFRFLGLIDDAGRPTAALRMIVRDKTNRKATMRKILEASYARIVGLGLTKLSPRQFDTEMRQYGMTGETHKKVISFFLRASKYAELPMSPLLGRKTRTAGPRQRGRTEKQSVSTSQVPAILTSDPIPSALSKTVSLKSGGSLTLILEISVLELTVGDREFVFKLIDKFREYEQQEGIGSE